MTRVYQEFYCNECDGYFRANLNMALNIKVTMICPSCGHKHDRCVVNGRIVNYSSAVPANYSDEILVPKSAYSKKPKFGTRRNARSGTVIDQEKQARFLTKTLWEAAFGK